VRLVTALTPEAAPLIEHYRLEKVNSSSMFPLYRNDTIYLVVSGIGKTLAAAATAYLHAMSGELPNQLFLNIGIAGHRRAITGASRVASRITDQSTGQTWYPSQIICDSLDRSPLITVETVERVYAEDAAYDMEAAGFYPVAWRASTLELVQSLKVISDHPGELVADLDLQRIQDLIGNSIDEIDSLVKALQNLADIVTSTIPTSYSLDPFVERWHFTVTQRHRLRRVLERWAVLEKDESPLTSVPSDCPSARDTIEALENALVAKRLDLHEPAAPNRPELS
jgi:hypothetical protein